MFRRTPDKPATTTSAPERVGEIELNGIVVIGETGRVTCDQLLAATVVVAGSLKGNIKAYRVEISNTGRVWGDVVTTSFATEEGAFLRGKITMEEQLDLGLAPELDAAQDPVEQGD
jgi:cytoskeletal protein CcmA (bactofilin family)